MYNADLNMATVRFLTPVCFFLKVVEKAIQQSLKRMRVKSLDCLQFHWWDYSDKRYLEALGHLSDLQQEGVIRMYILS